MKILSRNWIDLKIIVSHEKSDDSMENTFENIARGQREGRLSDVLDIMVVKIVPTGISCKNDLRIIIRLSERLLCHCGHVASRIARVSCVYFVQREQININFNKHAFKIWKVWLRWVWKILRNSSELY